MIKVLAVIVVAVIALLLYAATCPNSFRVQRSLRINAAPDRLFALLNDFRQWSGWSPWEKMDPNMQRTFSGPDVGVGTVYEWQGNKKVGKGRMEILESSPSTRLRIKLDFFSPFEAHNTTEFTLQPQSNGTDVIWIMYGPSPFMSKLMGVVFNMDKLVGGDFERGLTNLKVLAEK